MTVWQVWLERYGEWESVDVRMAITCMTNFGYRVRLAEESPTTEAL